MAFSGSNDLAHQANYLESIVGAIALDEGFALNHRKTRLSRSSQRQRLAGIVVNEKPNIERGEWDRLKATLHNCVRFGPDTQNRDGRDNFRAHLRGRLAHVTWVNPTRAKKLWRLWDQIAW